MSDDNNNSEPFDFDFGSLDADEPQVRTGDSAFDLGNPMGDSSLVDDLPPLDGGVSADNPFLNDSKAGGEETNAKKKGGGGWFSKGKKEPKEKPEKKVNLKKETSKKEKTEKAEKPARESVPRDWETILCMAFSLFLLASLVMFNVAAFLTRGPDIWQTLCFMGVINLIGLPAAAVPYLFYKFPKERTLPNVMLGIAAVAMFSGLILIVTDFYRYAFMIKPL